VAVQGHPRSLTSYYIASHTGCLDRVLREARLPAPDYGRRTWLVVGATWILLVWNVIHYVYQMFSSGRLNDLALTFLSRTLPEACVYVVKVISGLLQLQALAAGMFPQAMNYMVMIILCDQFRVFNEDFSKSCINSGDRRGQLSAADFEHFRRRHQALSRSVHVADRFLALSRKLDLVVIAAATVTVAVAIAVFSSCHHHPHHCGFCWPVSVAQHWRRIMQQCRQHNPSSLQHDILSTWHHLIRCWIDDFVHFLAGLLCLWFIPGCRTGDNA